MNVIDRCWRRTTNWSSNRQRLAMCSIGFAGKMSNNIGRGLTRYVVTDPTDDPLRPRYGTLRHGATLTKGKVWITFQRDMVITLKKPLLVKSMTTIDGRGANVHIANGASLVLYQVSNVIIHGLHFHDCKSQSPGAVVIPGGHVMQLSENDGDAIRLVQASKVWIDHNTFSNSEDGLLDVTRGSTGITVSNNWFKDHDKVMLLGHDDAFLLDKKMKVSLLFNRFGPNCNQRMPRARHGYVHVVNNLYDGWGLYAIGGSMSPSIRSEGNLYIARVGDGKEKKKVTARIGGRSSKLWNWVSLKDRFENKAYFKQSGRRTRTNPGYNRMQRFRVANANQVRALTRNAGALRCSAKRVRC
ncbi:pectate lyase 1-like [Dioscorea cayenensis subsp. rotundata]|uniref:Pectate lyase n=1 Tax=Dioscorea cayennensis subsp. rotundata TaxID=55577 RepID=A0AB40BNM4_DIOCR|nr:pectate lyase 1-like [Dioscorea cayenensis subsp. rotundata]